MNDNFNINCNQIINGVFGGEGHTINNKNDTSRKIKINNVGEDVIIQAFIKVIEFQSHVISLEDKVELQQLVSNLPENNQQIVKIIENWLQSKSSNQFFQAYEQQLELISNSHSSDSNKEMNTGDSKFSTSPNQSSSSCKVLVENAIKQNCSLSDNARTE